MAHLFIPSLSDNNEIATIDDILLIGILDLIDWVDIDVKHHLENAQLTALYY